MRLIRLLNTMSLAALTIVGFVVSTSAQGTAFTYQGSLKDNGSPANGTYALTFAIFDSLNGGARLGNTITNLLLNVTGGVFTTTLDFGLGVFTGEARWLEVGVRAGNSGGAFTLLNPRQAVTPTPYAMYAGGVSATGINGTIPVTSLATNIGLWTAAGTNIHYSNGNVGIGTATPIRNLHVQQPGQSLGAIQVGANAAGGTNLIHFGDRQVNGLGFVYLGENGVDDRLELRANEFFFNNGAVGIGTNTPAQKLHVVGSALVSGSVAAQSAQISGTATAGSMNVSGNVAVAGDLTASGNGIVRNSSSSQLRMGFTSGSFTITLPAGAGYDIQFVIPNFAGAASTVRVCIAQFIPTSGSGFGFQQFLMTVYAVDTTANLCTVRFFNSGAATATMDGTLYLMTTGVD